jgi:hypothetical protein
MGIKFEIIEGKVEIPPSSLTIPELKELWKRDKKKSKNIAYMELCYVYHMADNNSEYADYSYQHKEETVRRDHIKDEDWQPDEAVLAAIHKYQQLQETPAMRYLQSQNRLVEKITQRMDDVDQGELEDEKAMEKILASSERANKIILALPKLKEAVRKEQVSSERIRGGGETGMYED